MITMARAGDVVGTPDWQVDAMWEADAAAEWERLNEPDPAEDQMKEAAGLISKGLSRIDDGLGWISDAVAILDGTPMADKVQSLMESIEDLAVDLGILKNHYERGERD